MTDGRNGGGRKPRPIREIPFEQIEHNFTLAVLGTSPAVGIRTIGGWYIRLHVGRTWGGGNEVTDKFDYFHLSEDGTVQSAPRGYAKDYKPGRITGMAHAHLKYGGVA